MNDQSHPSTWVEIDLGAVKNNVRLVRQGTNAQVMAIVKANGYGHGSVPMAQAALRSGATWCGVARVDEALELRQAGLDCSILLLGYTPPDRMLDAILQKVSMTVWTTDQVQHASALAESVGMPARLHLKLDTGMSRLGVQPEETVDLVKHLTSTPGIIFEGLFTHFARADERDSIPTDTQEIQLRQVLSKIEAHGLKQPLLVHAYNSAASLTRSSDQFNLVRLGIAMYGLDPSVECPLPEGFRPALTWKATLSQVKTLPSGRGISYGHVYTTTKRERIGTAPMGYADGFRRIPGNIVLVGGRRIPVIGRVCMDQIMLQLDDAPEAQEGDEIVLIGTQNGAHISAEEVARRWDTINYEVVCGIGARVPRFYI